MLDGHFHSAVMAGAGTGKTYSLVENYLCALFGLDGSHKKKRPQEILALTFTQKAANEMRLRITKRLSDLLIDIDPLDPLIAIADQQQVELPNKEEIRRLLRAIPNAWISTFHGFCGMLLRLEASAIGLDNRFAIMSPREEFLSARNILRPMIIDLVVKDHQVIKSLVARFRLGNASLSLGLIDAILSTYFKLWEKGIFVTDLMASSLRVDSKSEINARVSLVDEGLADFLRLDSSAQTRAKLDRIATEWISLRGAIEQGSESQIAEAFYQLKKSSGGNFGCVQARRSMVQAIDALGASLVDHFTGIDAIEVVELIENFHKSFKQFKSDANVFSFSDLLIKTKEALSTDPQLRSRIRNKISHILVDEYQDTSPLQEDLIALLSLSDTDRRVFDTNSPALDMTDLKGGASLFVVGDKKQSIYGFRGANAALFDRMIAKMRGSDQQPSFSQKLLTINRRSKKRVIDLINLVADHTLSAQGYSQDHALVAHDLSDDGRCGLWVNEEDAQDRTSSNLTCASVGVAKLLRDRQDVRPSQVVVLVRRIRSATAIKSSLAELGIPSLIVGGEGFYQQQEVVDLLSALKLINDPSDPLATAVVLRSPLVLLRDQELMRVEANSDHGFTLLGAAICLEKGELSEPSAQRLKKFLHIIEQSRKRAVDQGLITVVDELISDTDYAYAAGVCDQAVKKWANLEKLRTILVGSDKNPFTAIDDLYRRILEENKEPQGESRITAEAVTIMTIHQAKGLEFDVVVLADSEGALPNAYGDILADKSRGLAIRAKGRPIFACLPAASKSDDEHGQSKTQNIARALRQSELDELSRLLYVALTRAKKELYLSCSRAGFDSIDSRPTLLGLFLRSMRAAKDRFVELCPIEFMPQASSIDPLPSMTTGRSLGDAVMFKGVKKTLRLFASAADIDADQDIKEVIRSNFIRPRQPIDGNLAHKLLSSIGDVIRDVDRLSPSDLDDLLSASMRSLGWPTLIDAHTLKAVKQTALAIKDHLPRSSEIIFEMPLVCRPWPGMVVEGFADLVVIDKDFLGVIEFKSSLFAAKSINTYFQVMTYACALSAQSDKPIKFAVLLLGAEDKIHWQNFDSHAKNRYLLAAFCQLQKNTGI